MLFLAACTPEPADDEYVARVGDAYLTAHELEDKMGHIPPGQDSLQARDQVVEQWIRNQLLYQEAERRNLRNEPEVEERLAESERSLLVNSLIMQLEDEVGSPSQAEMQAYLDQHEERFLLREPYLNVRYLLAETQEDAESAREALEEADEPAAAWPDIVASYSADASQSRYFDGAMVAERRVRTRLPALQEHIEDLDEGDFAPIESDDNGYHLLQLVERVPEGTVPELAWVEDEVERRLLMDSRKQSVSREVQRLRNAAQAREELERP